MDFSTFKETLIQHLPENTDITVGNDFGVNFSILVDEEGYIHLREQLTSEFELSFRRVKTSVCISNIEFRKDDIEANAFWLIDGDDALHFSTYEGGLFCFYENGSNHGNAFFHFSKASTNKNIQLVHSS